jgi:poly-gamma-glutamate synthesis protein (capsule biosynthesis protein)
LRFPAKLAKSRWAIVLGVVLASCFWFAALPAIAQEPVVSQEPIPDAVWQSMQGRSWHESFADAQCARPEDCTCPPRESLVLLSVPYRDFDDRVQVGQLIVAKAVADEVADAFDEIFASGQFRIAAMELVDRYGGDDDASMAANNTSAFNCRLTTGGSRLSAHAFGTAIDVNPVQNPYVKGDTTLPPAGRAYDEASERSGDRPGVIVEGDAVTTAFARRGWVWGGDWSTLKDFQHFSKDGR